MESAQGKDLLFIGEELYLINEKDPEDRVGYYKGRLYFYYGYSLYCYDPIQGELRIIKEFAEGDHWFFGDGKAYIDCRSNEENRLEVIDLKTAKVLRTEEGAAEGLSSGRHGVAYRLEEKLVVERTDGISQFSIDKNHTVYGLLLAKTGVFVKTQKEYQFYSYSKV